MKRLKRRIVLATAVAVVGRALAVDFPAVEGDGTLTLVTAAVACAARDVSARVLVPFKAHGQMRNGEKTVLVWRENGSVTVTKPCTVELLLVGGGGGGGTIPNSGLLSAGGGGGGGFVHKTAFELTPGDWDIVVGVGGATSQNGGDTSVFGLTAYGGGGGGGASNNPTVKSGASGGGASLTMAETGSLTRDGGLAIHGDQGHAGGQVRHVYGAGGGGGAGAAAPDDRPKDSQPASGGDGLPCSITGTEVWYAGGGAGSRMEFPYNKADGNVPCLGGKGGGGSVAHSTDEADRRGTDGLGGGGAGGYRGGSGVVVLSFVDDVEPGFSEDFAVTGDGTLFGVGDEAYGRIFSADGLLTVTGSGLVDILLVGGGGGGGACDATYGGAGGGAGGFVYFTNVAVAAGTYTVKVGKGGSCSSNGCESVALALIAHGGGAGGSVKSGAGSVGSPGGSGGGGRTSSGTVVAGGAALGLDDNLGHAGGSASNYWAPGGGGGAGEAGHDTDTSKTYVDLSAPGRGGNGLPCSITGHEVWYAGGGTGCRFSLPATIPGGRGGGAACGAAGRDGLGGGGSGGQRGGDGVVIVRVNRQSSVPRTFEGATGGAIRRSKGHFIHTFDANGTFVLPQAGWVEVLIVGGGGGGGANGTGDYSVYGGAGGGAGGFVYRQELLLDAGSYPVTVGAGGAIEQNGGNSSVFGLIAYGGGAGARYGSGWPRAQNGASGGGATISFEETMSGGVTRMGGKAVHDDPDGVQVNAGHDGGSCSHCYGTSGGGGAGAPGGASTSSTPSAGGDGLPCSITGEEVWYAGGGGGYRPNWSAGGVGGKGGGGSSSGDAARRKGVDGLGGGGSGGAAGGRGVVIIRYKYPPRGLILLVR